jgi:hypothetical protein
VLTEVFAGLALCVSIASFTVSVLTFRSSGPRVELNSHSVAVRSGELWLELKLVNRGRAEIDVDGASCDLLGPTVNALPHRLKPAASHVVLFRAPLDSIAGHPGSVTANIGLGNGRTITKQLRFTDMQQATIAAGSPEPPTSGERLWIPPTQEEL